MKRHQPLKEAAAESDEEFLKKRLPSEEEVVKGLAKHIHKIWLRNQEDFKPVRLEMISLLRRVKGEYEPSKLAAIREFKGSEAYIRSAENKARTAESWIKDIYRADAELPWALEPTAVPDLPDETLEQIKVETQQQALTLEAQLTMAGETVDTGEIAKLIQEYYEQQLDKAREEMVATAKERCERAATLINDQNQEGGWDQAFKDFLYYFTRLKFGVIKGPVLARKKKQVWAHTESGYELITEDALVNDVYAPSPFNIYPSNGMKSANDGDLVEIHELSRQSVAGLIGVPGYSDLELKAVLAKYDKGELRGKWFTIEDEVTVKQATQDKSQTVTETNDTLLAQEFYGSVSGRLLKEWDAGGTLGDLDPSAQYPVNCWKIGDHVIKAVINPDGLARKPYHFSSWAKNPEWIVGEGLIEFAGPIEDSMNAIIRALINNAAIASGPLVEEDSDRVPDDVPLYPWRKVRSTSRQMKNDGPAVNFYQPQMHVSELVNAWSFFAKLLDEMTVPSYAQGGAQAGVTTGTATVFTQLLAAAARSIKAVVANIDDDIITPYIQMCYDYNMKFSPDESIKGDSRVVAKGVAGLQAREQGAQRKIEYMQIAMTPVLSQILGAKNIGALAAQIAKSNDIHLPDMARLEGGTDLEATIQQMLMAQAGVDPMQENGQMAHGGGAPAKGQGVNPNGAKAGVAHV